MYTPPTLVPPLTVNGIAPAFVDKKTAAIYLESPKLVERLLWATRHTEDKWVVIAMNQEGDPKQKTLMTTMSVEQAAERIARGERPPKIGKVQKLQCVVDSFFDPEDEIEGEVSRAFPESFNPDVEEEKALAAAFQKEQKKREGELDRAEKERAEKARPELLKEKGETWVEIDVEL